MYYTGHVTRFNNERYFGFVEDETENSYFFFFDKALHKQLQKKGLVDKIHKFCSGDEVQFKLRPSQKDPYKLEAYDVTFIRNERREKLIQQATAGYELMGYIKLIDNDTLFIKHISTRVFLPLEISHWVTDLDEIYTDRIDTLVSFKLNQTQKIDNLKAELTNIKFIEEYYQLQSAMINQTILEAIITGKNSKGSFCTILNKQINCFIPKLKDPYYMELLQSNNLTKGNTLNVKVIRINNNKSIALQLTN